MYKTLEEVLQQLPFIQQVEKIQEIQSKIQALMPSFPIRCSLQQGQLVLLAENAMLAKRLHMYIDNLKPVLDEYDLEMPKILISPFRKI
jgi:hypothetical protein